MKNWKFIQVGNKIEISGVAGKLPPDSEISKTIYEELKKNNYDKDKTVLSLSIKYKAIPNPRMFFEDAVEKVIKSYKNRTVNESIDKQVWSMFKGLSKDAEKEVGNENADDKFNSFIKKYGYPKSKEEAEWLYKQAKHEGIDESYLNGMKRGIQTWKVGNKAIVLKDGNVWVVLYANETKSQEFESEEEAREFAKKVGNKVIAGDYYDVVMSGSHFYIYKNGGSQIIGPFNSEQEAQNKIDAIEKERSRTGNETLGQWAKAKPRIINDESTRMRNEYNAEIQRLTKKAEELRRMGQGRSAIEVEKQIEKLGKELRELGNKKTGNAGQWNSTKTIYGKWDDKAGRPDEEYARITWLGQGKGGLVNIWKGNQMTSEKYGSNDLEDLRRWAEQRIGNETKGERKFGKVMGEFERGELKSGSGEKVTDPAQAKAIAYSEADKVDNLKRARNAMAKNQKITLWKGNDTVYISEDGTVQYLESNAFETDRDKFESQEKAIEELTKQGYRKK